MPSLQARILEQTQYSSDSNRHEKVDLQKVLVEMQEEGSAPSKDGHAKFQNENRANRGIGQSDQKSPLNTAGECA